MMRVHSIDFHGDRLIGVEADGAIQIPVKPICEGIGLNWENERRRIGDHPTLVKGTSIIEVPFGAGGRQRMVCVSLRRINFWLATIHPNRVENNDARARVILYQEECADVLFAYFSSGKLPDAKEVPTLLQADLFDAPKQQPAPPLADAVAFELAAIKEYLRRIFEEVLFARADEQLGRTEVAKVLRAVKQLYPMLSEVWQAAIHTAYVGSVRSEQVSPPPWQGKRQLPPLAEPRSPKKPT